MTKLISLLVLLTCLFTSTANADVYRLIDDGTEALQLRVDLIENAKEEILISYFIYADDRNARQFSSLLRNAARRGVKVTLLIDEMFNDIDTFSATHLLREGVKVLDYNKFKFIKLSRSLRRMHDKVMIIDNKYMILGGRNIEDTYYDNTEKNYDDRDVLITGNSVIVARDYYKELVQAPHIQTTESINVTDPNLTRRQRKKLLKNYMENEEKVIEAEKVMDKAYQSLYVEDGIEMGRTNLSIWTDGQVDVHNIQFIHDPISVKKQKGRETTREVLYDLIRNAKEEVIIESPYLVLDKALKKLFRDTIERGVRIRIVTNSLEATDAYAPQAAYIGQRKKIVKMGIELYEFVSTDCFHAKSLVIDKKIAVVGSYNFDPRSAYLNTETMGLVESEEVAQQLLDAMDVHVKMSVRIMKNGKPEGSRRALPNSSFKKRLITRLLQYLVVPFFKSQI
jgi:putative cardiolipin synthase